MSKFGLSKEQKVRIFGSRAIGTYRANSDIDQKTLGNISLDLDDLPMPYLFDVKAISQINHPRLLEHIKQYSQIIYNISYD